MRSPFARSAAVAACVFVGGVFVGGVFVGGAVGCSDPPPPPGAPLAVSAIAGSWRADDITLDIADDGRVSYEKTRGTHTTLTGMPLSNLTTTGFDVGAFGLNTHFVIDAVPATVDGATRMTVDGVVLQKRSAGDLEALAALAAENAAAAGDSAPRLPAPAPATLPAVGTLESLAGHWEAEGMRLHVATDGKLHYARGGTKIDGATVSNITPTSFEAGVFGITTTFKVDQAPHIVDGKVLMTVDGVALTWVQP